MSEKTPRLRPHEKPNKYIRQYEQKLGQLSLVDPRESERGWKMSLTDGVPIPTDIGDVAPCDTAEVMEAIDNRSEAVIEMDVEAERSGNTWNWSR